MCPKIRYDGEVWKILGTKQPQPLYLSSLLLSGLVTLMVDKLRRLLSPHVRVLSRAATNQLWVLSSSFFSEPGAMTSSSRGGAWMQGASWTLAPTGHGDYHLRIIIHASRPSVMQGILERNETDEDKLVATDCGGHVIGRSTRTRGPWPKPDCTSLVLHCNKMYMLCIFFSFFFERSESLDWSLYKKIIHLIRFCWWVTTLPKNVCFVFYQSFHLVFY
jgi:hypothetical protein